MASFRRPKGTVTRHIPDWKTGQLHSLNNAATGGALGTTNGFGLVNDSNKGQPIVVWHVQAAIRPVASPTTQQIMTLGFFPQAPLGITVQGQPLDLMNPWLGGSCWGIPTASSLTTYDFMDLPVASGYYSWPHDWPLCVIRPTQSLVCYMIGPVQDVAVTFVWEVADGL